MKKAQVTVTADKTSGLVINPSKNNPDFAWIRVQQVGKSIDDNGFLQTDYKSAFIKGAPSDLEELGYVAGEVLEGQIVVTESTTPPNPKKPSQDVKMSGANGIPCTIGGQVIYRTTKYTTNMELVDTKIAHDNGDAIKAHQTTLAKTVVEDEAL